jgi:calcium-activated chloride channel regulator 4
VHNWASFRYGVFSEVPYKNLDNNEEFYFNTNGDLEATRCNLNITGHLRNPIVHSQICDNFQENGLPSIDCIYEDDIKPKLAEKRIGSLMYKPFLTQVSHKYETIAIYKDF